MLQNCLLLQNSAAPSSDVIPSRSEIIQCLGSPLAEIFLQYTHPKNKKLVCISQENENELEFNELSYNQFVGKKTYFQPPPNDERVKSLTHEGILVLGQQVLEKFEEIQKLKRKESQTELIEARYLFDAEKRRALDLQEEKLRLQHEKCYNDLCLKLKFELEEDLRKAKQQHDKQLKNCLIKERLDVMQEMMQRISNEMSDIVISLCKRFHENLMNERSNFIKVFNYCLRVERDVAKQQIAEIERKRIRDLLSQKHELELQNLTNLTYVLCVQKRNYSKTKQALLCCYQKKIEILKKLIISLLQVCQKNSDKRKKDIQEDKIQFYKSKILELVKQFQKLIDFTFDAIPGQADFLFNLDSFLCLKNHLENDKIQPVEKEFYRVTEIILDIDNKKWEPEQSLLDIIHEIDVMACDFENYIYSCSENPNEIKTVTELLKKGEFVIKFNNKIN